MSYVMSELLFKNAPLDAITSLRLPDKISLIFLVCSEPEEGLHLMCQLEAAPSLEEENGLMKQFILRHVFKSEIQFKSLIIESIILMKNFKILKHLGLQKCVKDDSLYSGHVYKLRKYLYLLSESLTAEQTSDFILSVSGKHYEPPCFLEKIILQWVVEGVVSLEIDNPESLRKMTTKLENYGNVARRIKETLCGNIPQDKQEREDECYRIIDGNELGYCIVINQEQFCRNSELHHIMPEVPLTPRPGSEVDVDSIRNVFSRLGFTVLCHQNVIFEEFKLLLSKYAKLIPQHHSMFVLVIMSHGTEDVVYTADSVPVKVEDVEMAFQARMCQQLVGKPKIFIVQACQGKKLQRVMMDMPTRRETSESSLHLPERGDALIAWSTVKGYASFRDRIQGSWFIQELCSELWQNMHSRDLVDIVTRVNNKLRQKTCQGMHMVPSLSLSLCKKIKFPALKHNNQ